MVVNVASVRKLFGDEIILEDVSFRIDAREKVALIGRNGTGKTTLLRILAGQSEADGGSVHLSRGARIGYLKQEIPVENGRTVLEEAQAARAEVLEMGRRLEELEHVLETNPSADDLEEYATLHERFLDAQGYAAANDVRVVLAKMGFEEEDYGKPVAMLSGGEKTRLVLARLLLEEPDLLVLDEPTNHLDLQATEWLEGWIRGYPGAVLIVSHDRVFLQETVQKIVLLENGRTKSYPGPFDKFLKLRASEEERLAEVARRQKEEMDKLDEYVRRFMGSERTAQARGRLKMLERMKDQRVEAPKADKNMKAGFQSQKRSGDIVVQTKGLSKSFDEQVLFENLDWTVQRGERWGVIGQNGTGKSTLVSILLGLQDPDSGTTKLGSNVYPDWFAQEASDLDWGQSPLEYIMDTCGLKPEEARKLLGRFLFSGDDVFRKIGTLSGGEKNKLALARLTYESPNLLVLDEPTNHLDFDSREALADVLRSYKGTLILVSHDRWLLEQTTDRTMDIRRDGIRQYPGSYADYRRALARESAAQPRTTPTDEPKPKSTLSQREISKEISRLEKEFAQAEDNVADLEARLEALEAALANPSPGADLLEQTTQHENLQKQVAEALSYWEQLGAQLEETRSMQGRPGDNR